jgi:peptidoglycan/xylan/chitin deacetylase (PgdA/CDA1 family)
MGGDPQGPQCHSPLSPLQGQAKPVTLFVQFSTRIRFGRCLVMGLLLLLLDAGRALAAPAEASIFIYHRFGETKYPSTNISAEVFAAQLDLLAEENYTVLVLSDVVNRLAGGESLPDKCAVLTVDDAFTSFLDVGLPLIERHGFPVTLFVSTGMTGRPGYLDWEQLRSLRQRGVEIGSHGHAHAHMADRQPGETLGGWRQRIESDLEQVGREFKRELGFVPEVFAYPYGEYSPELIELLKNFGYKAAVAQQSGVASRYYDLYELPRFPMGGAYATLADFASKLKMHALPVRVVRPSTMLIGSENPPQLELQVLDLQQVDLTRINCFLGGKPDCLVENIDGKPGFYRITARHRLTARRSKYTLTAPGRAGGWFWFSQLWVNSEVEEGY